MNAGGEHQTNERGTSDWGQQIAKAIFVSAIHNMRGDTDDQKHAQKKFV